nr:hypothetical protein P5668_11760 [Bacillus subtilis]
MLEKQFNKLPNQLTNKKYQESIDFETLSDDQLKEIAKDRGIPGYFNMKRDTLLTKLKG